ncbi:hypothetical protein Ae717Ps2_6896c [Pseudonocardia sp. Ae717_Ps2]|nr:hypothetical protein Ae717Ps2_6896c [Pseudonocardia sp. Ae717_Ps2]
MRHHRGHSLRELRRALSAAWRHLTQSRGWKRWKTDLDMDYVRGVEGTHTDLNGWHLHIHALLIFPTDVSAEIPALTCEVYTRWAAGLAKKGMSATAEHASTCGSVTARWRRWASTSRSWPSRPPVAGGSAASAAPARRSRSSPTRSTPQRARRRALAGVGTGQPRHAAARVVQRPQAALRGHRGQGRGDRRRRRRWRAGRILPARSWKKIYPVAEDLIIATRHGGVPAARAWLDARAWPSSSRLTPPNAPSSSTPETPRLRGSKPRSRPKTPNSAGNGAGATTGPLRRSEGDGQDRQDRQDLCII